MCKNILISRKIKKKIIKVQKRRYYHKQEEKTLKKEKNYKMKEKIIMERQEGVDH